jgi:hypothetical protein
MHFPDQGLLTPISKCQLQQHSDIVLFITQRHIQVYLNIEVKIADSFHVFGYFMNEETI